MEFKVDSKFNEENNCWNVSIFGEIDIFNSKELKSKLLLLLKEKEADLKLDCNNLDYIDSTGLGALVAILKHVKVFGGDIYITNIKPSIAKLFKITNLDKVFLIEVK